MVSDVLDLKESLFGLDVGETVAVYAVTTLRSMLVIPNRLERIMRVIRLLNPCLMVVSEFEANHNSPMFANRFVEALFFFSVYFGCLATCMKWNCVSRDIVESVYFAEGIRNMVAAEGEERKVRHVKFDVWRAFLVQYGNGGGGIKYVIFVQACLVPKTFA